MLVDIEEGTSYLSQIFIFIFLNIGFPWSRKCKRDILVKMKSHATSKKGFNTLHYILISTCTYMIAKHYVIMIVQS